MTDRELLECAAKAAGLANPRYHEATGKDYDCGTCILHDTQDGRQTHSWNPLTDDGDALRLAVTLDLLGDLDHWLDVLIREGFFPDQITATRRAIVRAAAEIGKGMQ